MKKNILRSLALLLSLALLMSLISGCAVNEELPLNEDPVTITVVGAWDDCLAIDAVGRAFTEKYPNCTIRYESLQNYDESLPKRLAGDGAADLFFSYGIQADSELLDYAQELLSRDDLDLSSAFDGLVDNFLFFDTDSSAAERLYSIPLGAEMRGMYVNKTLLDSLNIAIPADQKSFLSACKTLMDNGYIPLHGNPGIFAQMMLYPWICNIVANSDNYSEAYDKVNNRSDGLGEMFKEPFEFLYSLVENGYYDYKFVQDDENWGLFTDSTDDAYARDFFNITQDGETWKKADDIGKVAFMPQSLSLRSAMERAKDDYHSNIEYTFVPAPVGVDGGYVYMSPSRGLAVNKNSANLDWTIKFLNFLFIPEYNTLFSEEFNIIPNTKDAFEYVSNLYDVPDNHVSQLGEVTFDYDFYHIIADTLVDISKANNPKYMQTNEDGSVTLYPLEHYIDAFKEEIKDDVE